MRAFKDNAVVVSALLGLFFTMLGTSWHLDEKIDASAKEGRDRTDAAAKEIRKESRDSFAAAAKESRDSFAAVAKENANMQRTLAEISVNLATLNERTKNMQPGARK